MGKFKAGDVVKLRSGGPLMTVTIGYEPYKPSFWDFGSRPPATAFGNTCIWLDAAGFKHEATFPDHALALLHFRQEKPQ